MSQLNFRNLVEVLHEPERVENWSNAEWQDAILVFRFSRLLASMKYRLEEKDQFESLPDNVRFHLESAAVLAERQVQQVLFEVSELQSLFSATPEIRPVLLKGAAYIANGTRNSKGRICSDIDLLVERKFLNQSESLLMKSLWRHNDISDYDEKYYREFAHEIPPLIHLERATVLDLHHNIYMSISNRAPKIEVFLNHLQKSPAGLYTLTAPAAFIHSVIHLYLNEDIKFGLRDVYDQWKLCEEFSSEQFWQDCINISRDCGFLFELMLSIGVIKSFFNLRLPEFVETIYTSESKALRFKFWWVIYQHAFTPEHFLVNTKRATAARMLVVFRGHWAKMPLSILIKHTSVKVYDFVFGVLVGERDKQTSQTKGLQG